MTIIQVCCRNYLTLICQSFYIAALMCVRIGFCGILMVSLINLGMAVWLLVSDEKICRIGICSFVLGETGLALVLKVSN